MISNDHEVQVSQQRIEQFQRWLAQLRKQRVLMSSRRPAAGTGWRLNGCKQKSWSICFAPCLSHASCNWLEVIETMTPAQNPQLQSFWPASNTLRHTPRVTVTGRRGVLGPARCMGAEVRDAGFTRYV